MELTYCVTTAQLQKTLDKFLACTYLPISAFTSSGQHLFPTEPQQIELNKLMTTKITELANNKFSETNNTSHVIISLKDQDYIACYICQKNIAQGMFIIGPYNRPIDLLPYLIALLRNLQEGYLEIRIPNACQQQAYSLHVQKALNYMTRHYNKPITLDTMAQYLKINKCYFATILKQETGHTFSATLNQIRVERSKEYLKRKKYSILDIALNVGFTNQNYYCTIFKRLTNMTPTEFRQKMVAS